MVFRPSEVDGEEESLHWHLYHSRDNLGGKAVMSGRAKAGVGGGAEGATAGIGWQWGSWLFEDQGQFGQHRR